MKILKKIAVFIFVTISILSLFSCKVYNSKKDNSKTKETVYETTVAMAATSKNGFARANAKTAMAADIVSEESFSIEGSSGRKLVKSVSLNAETKTFESSIEWLKKYISSFNGIIDNSYIDTGNINSANYNKSAYFAVRIPADKLDSFLSKIGDNLNVTFKQENISDVTDDYFDSESKLNSLKIEEENLNEMLKSAKSVDEMIKVEDKLSEVRANIESINRKIKNYDKQINYSSVDISISEVKDLTDTKVDKNDFSRETLNKKLLKTVEDVKLFLKQVAAYIFINIPWIILVIIVIIIEILIYMIIRKAFFDKKDDKGNSLDEKASVTTSDNGKKSNENKKNKKSHNDKKENLSDEETFDKVMEEVNKVVLGEDTSGDDVEVEFYEQE